MRRYRVDQYVIVLNLKNISINKIMARNLCLMFLQNLNSKQKLSTQ